MALRMWQSGRALVAVLMLVGTGSTMSEVLKIEFKSLTGSGPAAGRLRSASGNNGALLMVSKRELTPPVGAATAFSAFDPMHPSSGWRQVANLNEMVPAELNWDVALPEKGIEIVRERPAGATNSLALWTASDPSRPLTADYAFQSFSEPRFVKGTRSPEWVTAVMDNRSCVALSLVRAEPYRKLSDCDGGLLVRRGAGFVFFYKTNASGSARAGVLPGRLHMVQADAQLRASGASLPVFETVYDFDADVIGGKIVVFATTPKGIGIASGPAQGTAPKMVAQEQAIPMTLTSPAVSATASGNALIAALDAKGPGSVRILTAEIPVP